jgi:endonuclease YncB( thermonuclease family)
MARKPPFIEAHPVSFAEAREHGLVRGECLYVVDGDTADFMIDLGWYQYAYVALRLARVNAAELRGTSGPERELALRAKARVEGWVHNQPVLIRSEKQTTTFERFVAEVYFQMPGPPPSGVGELTLGARRWYNLSDLLLAEGLAAPSGSPG